MRFSTGLRTAATVAITALMLAACGGDEGGDDGGNGGAGQQADAAKGNGVLEFGYVLPETGELAYLGPPQVEALNYAVSQINDAGGVLEKPIPDVVGRDEAAQEAVATQSADQVLGAGVDAIIGAAASGMSLAIIDKITGAQVAQCSGSNTAPTFTDYDDGGYYFRTAPSDVLQGPVLANTIIGDGRSNVALVARADDYGRGLMDATKKSLEDSGATVALAETYDPKSTNFAPVIQKISNTNPDAVAVIGFEEGTQILQGMLEADLGPDKIGVYGADGLRNTDLASLVSKDDPGRLSGMKGTAPASVDNEEFVSGLQKFAPDLAELQFAPQVFDCVNIIALAAEQAKSDDPREFAPEIVSVTKDGEKCGSFEECKQLIADGKDIDYDGVSGPLDFVDAGEPGQASIEVYTYNDQGKLETVGTEQSKLQN
ncbi:amino acid/amide ABC transporter substrate-binding protein (HAAT family) [Tamaricihabitans halophyticus]|uniref:Amino acid/amide ABC transporter substrate-binding protein (HAAT family) n=1 Tax=Tamaricihabitans halophyticus TaxID=1262583 RepID=A0A4R2QFH3_9PSEU|nr:amino acid/amide ABC transporter substrate-binding protein (HAAT family) [Tamaricihabitans halophyticus]